jgi:hypothetical protein
MTTRLPFTQASLRRAIAAARKEGLRIAGIRRPGLGKTPRDLFQPTSVVIEGYSDRGSALRQAARNLISSSERPRLCFATRKQRWGARAIRDPDEIVDMLHVIEKAASYFFTRAEMGKNAGRKQSEVDEDYKQAAHLAALAAPYRHGRLSAMKLAGDPNNPARFKDDGTAEELRAEMMRRIAAMADAGIIDLTALPPPNGSIAKRPPPRGVNPSGLNGD